MVSNSVHCALITIMYAYRLLMSASALTPLENLHRLQLSVVMGRFEALNPSVFMPLSKLYSSFPCVLFEKLLVIYLNF